MSTDAAVDSRGRRGRLGDRADRVRDAAAAADHPAEVVVGDRDLEDQVAVLLELLDHDRVGVLDQRPDEELEQVAHRQPP